MPHVQGGLDSTALLLIIAIVGTTVAPWQLFFQQSNVIDKRLTPRWMAYERADTWIGAFVVILGAAALMIVTAFAFAGTKLAGQFGDAGTAAAGLAHALSPVAGAMFALVLLNASLIGAAAVTLSTSYAFGDVFGIKHSLHRSWKDARGFYAIYAARGRGGPAARRRGPRDAPDPRRWCRRRPHAYRRRGRGPRPRRVRPDA